MNSGRENGKTLLRGSLVVQCTVGGEGVCVLHADGVVQVWSNL